ncbi:MAG: GntR family transcriptional regulator [Verrucomicrobiae bacterium]|nr:GntR family transcriptional regulator [Verrucomicrobiae bacterium]
MMPSEGKLKDMSHQPIYRQVEAFLKEQIEEGVFSPGQMLPSVKELCRQFNGINHLTVRQAIKNLAKQGLVETFKGKGTFVAHRTKTVAMVVPSLDNDELMIKVCNSVQRFFENEQTQTVILNARQDMEKAFDHVGRLQKMRLDGAIIFPVLSATIIASICRLKHDGFPVVLIDRVLEDIELPSVVADCWKGSYELAMHLIARGRKRIAWVGQVAGTSTRARHDGFRDALIEKGVAGRSVVFDKRNYPVMPVERDYREMVGNAVRQLMAETPRPDAIMFFTDHWAILGIEELKRMGVKIPEEVAVTGFDDRREATLCIPKLATARYPMEKLGEEAAKLLLARINDKNMPPKQVVLPVELVIRESA